MASLWRVFFMLEEVARPLYYELLNDFTKLAGDIGRIDYKKEDSKHVIEIYNKEGALVYRIVIEKLF